MSIIETIAVYFIRYPAHRVGVRFLTGPVLLAFYAISPNTSLLANFSLIGGLDFWHFSYVAQIFSSALRAHTRTQKLSHIHAGCSCLHTKQTPKNPTRPRQARTSFSHFPAAFGGRTFGFLRHETMLWRFTESLYRGTLLAFYAQTVSLLAYPDPMHGCLCRCVVCTVVSYQS